MKTTLKQLAEILNGNYWEKGNLKRVYLDKGHNTRKMSTKTFVFQDENGEFKVSCKVDCPSQHPQWCKSQEEEIKKSVYKEIANALSLDEIVKSENNEESKSVFNWSVEEIRKYQVSNLTGSFQTNSKLPQNVWSACRILEKKGKDDKYIRSLVNPLAILLCVNTNSQITVVGIDSQYSFWQTVKGKIPIPLASSSEEMHWCYEIYEGTPINKSVLDNDKTNPKGKILHTYEAGYFNC